MKKLFISLLSILTATSLVAFGQELTAREQEAFEAFSKSYGPFEDINDVGDFCVGNFGICEGFADEWGLKNYDEGHEKMAEEYLALQEQCGNNPSCYLEKAVEFAQEIEELAPEIALEVVEAADLAGALSDFGEEGIVVGGRLITENNFSDLVVNFGSVEEAYGAMREAMQEKMMADAAEYGFSEEDVKRMAEHMTESQNEFEKVAAGSLQDNQDLLLGPPEYVGGDYNSERAEFEALSQEEKDNYFKGYFGDFTGEDDGGVYPRPVFGDTETGGSFWDRIDGMLGEDSYNSDFGVDDSGSVWPRPVEGDYLWDKGSWSGDDYGSMPYPMYNSDGSFYGGNYDMTQWQSGDGTTWDSGAWDYTGSDGMNYADYPMMTPGMMETMYQQYWEGGGDMMMMQPPAALLYVILNLFK